MGTDLGFALLIGFASMKFTQLYKEVTRRIGLHQLSWWKTLISVTACLVLALTLIPHRSAGVRLLVGLGASGMAAVLHGLDTTLRAKRDDLVSQVLVRAKSRIR